MIDWKQTPAYQRGKHGEALVAQLLMARGWYVIPTYDYTGLADNKAPKFQHNDPGCSLVLPDLDIAHPHAGRRWAEVKDHAAPSYYRIGDQWQHGIQLKHWHAYQAVQRLTKTPVGLFIVEESSGWVLCQSIDALARHPDTDRRAHKRHGRPVGEYMYFNRDAFVLWHHVTNQKNLPIKMTQK